ncbi:M18 family aminopeptidase [Candidatus Riflebacteria bacterium]
MESVYRLLDFIDASPSPWHLVERVVKHLLDAGFSELLEGEPWSLTTGKGYFCKRNGTSIIAFRPGKELLQSGFRIVTAHTDSPNLRLRKQGSFAQKEFIQLGVEIYGAPIWNSWLDRDLSLAGQIFKKDGSTELFDFKQPILRIPQLGYQLNREVNEEGIALNCHEDLIPIFSTVIRDGTGPDSFLNYLAESSGIAVNEISNYEFCLYDTQKASIGGPGEMFILSARLDNQAMCHAGLLAFLAENNPETKSTVLALFDNEEVGSRSWPGAAGNFLNSCLERINISMAGDREDYFRILSRSFLCNIDMTHSIHPNFPQKHDRQDFPVINKGPVLKYNCNQKYTTAGRGHFLFDNLCNRLGIPLQNFTSRSDLKCGSTLAPILSSGTGFPSVDLGNAILAMHSIREMGGSTDHINMIELLKAFLREDSE